MPLRRHQPAELAAAPLDAAGRLGASRPGGRRPRRPRVQASQVVGQRQRPGGDVVELGLEVLLEALALALEEALGHRRVAVQQRLRPGRRAAARWRRRRCRRRSGAAFGSLAAEQRLGLDLGGLRQLRHPDAVQRAAGRRGRAPPAGRPARG